MQHWQPYLWDRAFLIHTDHYSLKYLLEQRLTTSPQQHWIRKLLGLELRVEYKAAHLIERRMHCHNGEEVTQLSAISQPKVPFLMQYEGRLRGPRSCNACEPR